MLKKQNTQKQAQPQTAAQTLQPQTETSYLYGSAASQYAVHAQAEQSAQSAGQLLPPAPQLTCSGLTLGYEGHAVATDINFRLNRGDYLCIVGENGSGKSTLIKTLLGLIPPLEGEIIFGDGLSARQIGYLPQQTAFQKDFPASC